MSWRGVLAEPALSRAEGKRSRGLLKPGDCFAESILRYWACLSGYSHHPQAESLGETLLLVEKKGAIAALVPTSETMAADQQLLADALFRCLFAEPTSGEAILRAKREMDPRQPGLRDVLRTFVLLGDAALRLVQP